jgi:hypothetical protein
MSTPVHLKPVLTNGQFDHWEMSVKGQPMQGAPYPHLGATKGSDATFVFMIDNPNGIQFQPNSPPNTSPIYVQPGTQKPASGVDGLDKIKVTDYGSAKNAQLSVHDGNKDPGQLTYVLNFVGAPQLDPIIDNTGGGPGSYPNYAYIVGGAVLLAAILWFVLKPMFRRPRPVEEDIKTR